MFTVNPTKIWIVYCFICLSQFSGTFFLEKQKVPFNIHYPVAPHKQKALKNLIKNKKFPITEKIHETIVSLPIASYFSQKKIKEFCLKINKFND